VRRVSTLMCRPGIRLGKSVISDKGITLLKHGVELNESYIQKLFIMGYKYLFIDDLRTEDIKIVDPLREETRAFARIELQQIFAAFSYKTAIGQASSSIGQCRKIALMIIEDLDHNNNESFMLTNMNMIGNNPEQRFIQNALNVCIYAAKMGLIERLSKEDIINLCMAALLHDLGTIRTPQYLLSKNGKLTNQEFSQVQKHTEFGYQMLKDIKGLPLSTAYCALQHHEKMDGSGYPLKLKDNQIHPFAKWIALLDAYDAMTNPRPYRNALMPHEALDVLYASAGTLYEKSKVELFRDNVAVFPVGLNVQLNTGETGIVSRVSPSFMHRPTIRILKTPSGGELLKPYEIDLAQHLNIMIRETSEEHMH
jgi:HD-GYP domain-containing protein (c-di-GMP phosphodiesterase class II)